MPSIAIIGTRGYPSYYGGFETAVRQLAPFLAQRGWDVTVYGRPGATKSESSATVNSILSVTTKGFETRSLSTLSYGLTASLDALRRRPDVALVMNVANGYWLPLLARAGIPTVVNVDGIEWHRAKWGPAAKAVFRGGARLTARNAHTLIVDAKAIGDYWINRFGRSGVYIPYGGSVPRGASLPPLGLTHRGYVLMVARFVPENTVPEFLDAIPALAGRWPVVVVGSSGYGGALDDRVAGLASQHDNVRWLGHIEDDQLLSDLWEHAGAYFHGHSVGGTNPALVQAMASGAPVVALDTVFNREVLESAGKFVARDASAIAQAIAEVMNSSGIQESLSRVARLRAEDGFDWARVCSLYESALTSAIGEPR